MISEEMKKIIDNMNYRTMLTKWRFALSGDPMFQGEVGKYFEKVMIELRKEIGDVQHTRISKEIGW